MKDFPLNELLAATDLVKVQDSLLLVFGHINKKLKLSSVIPLCLIETWDRPTDTSLLSSTVHIRFVEHCLWSKPSLVISTNSCCEYWDPSD